LADRVNVAGPFEAGQFAPAYREQHGKLIRIFPLCPLANGGLNSPSPWACIFASSYRDKESWFHGGAGFEVQRRFNSV
jgi:hypothetical protein